MAKFTQPTPEQEQMWKEWLDSKEPRIREVAQRFNPWTLYRLKSSGHRVTIYGVNEFSDGSIRIGVNVTGEFNAVAFDRSVFDAKPEDLEECDLPKEGELLGTLATEPEQVAAMIEFVKLVELDPETK